MTLLTPSTATNSKGVALSPFRARNTDGIDPGAGGTVSNGYLVYSRISVGDDQVAIKAGTGKSATKLVFAHNHFGSGHGMSIGSETNGGVSGITVCDLTIDNSLRTTGSPAGDVNGLRIKSDPTRGGVVDNVTYTDVCVRDVNNPIILNPMYSGSAGSLIPTYTNITIAKFHASSSTVSQTVTLSGFDTGHTSTIALDDVVVDGMTPTVVAQDAKVALGPGPVSFASSITGAGVTVTNNVSGTTPPIDCSGRWITSFQ